MKLFRYLLDIQGPITIFDACCIAFVIAAIALGCYGVWEMAFDPSIMPHIANDANPPSN